MTSQLSCPHCHRHVLAGAAACPRCLAPIRYGLPRRCIATLVVLGVLAIAYAAGLPALACQSLAPDADCDWDAALRLPALVLVAFGARTLAVAARRRAAVFGQPRLTLAAPALDSASKAPAEPRPA